MSTRHFLLVLLSVHFTKQLAFGLNAYSPEMCFILKGQDVGKHLKMNYSIYTDKKKMNLHFKISDLNSREVLYENNDSNRETTDISLDVNFLHDFMICWKNMDSEDKRINFTYKHTVNVPLDSKDVFVHMDLMNMFQERSEKLLDQIFEEKNQQDKYYLLLDNHEKDIKKLFLFKIGVLLVIVLIQVYLLTRLVDKNVKEIKTIIIGPQ